MLVLLLREKKFLKTLLISFCKKIIKFDKLDSLYKVIKNRNQDLKSFQQGC